MFWWTRKNMAIVGLSKRKKSLLIALAESYYVYKKTLPSLGESCDIIQLNMIDIAVANEILYGRVKKQEKAERVLKSQLEKCQKNGLPQWRIKLIVGSFQGGKKMARLIMRICGSEDQKLGEARPRETFAIAFDPGQTLAKIFQEYADKRLGSPFVRLNLVDSDSGQKKAIDPVEYCPEDGDLIEQSVPPLP